MKCPYCGKEIIEGTNKCDGCGAEIKSASSNNENQTYNYQNTNNSKSGIVIVIAFLLIAGVLSYFLLFNGGSSNSESGNEENQENTENNNNIIDNSRKEAYANTGMAYTAAIRNTRSPKESMMSSGAVRHVATTKRPDASSGSSVTGTIGKEKVKKND